MKFFRRKNKQLKRLQLLQTNTTTDTTIDADSCSVSRASRRECLDDMFLKLAESKMDTSFDGSKLDSDLSSVDPMRYKLLMSLSLAEKSANSDDVMKVRRLKSKLLSNFVRIDESSDTSFVSWNSDSDEDVGCELIDHSTPDILGHKIIAIRINEHPPESPKYDLTKEAFEVNVVSDDKGLNHRISTGNFLGETEPRYEVSINGTLSQEYIHFAEAASISGSSSGNYTNETGDYAFSDCSQNGPVCVDEWNDGKAEATAGISFVGTEIAIRK